MKDPQSHVQTESALDPAELTATTNGKAIQNVPNGGGVDFSIFAGVLTAADGSNYLDVSVQEATDSAFTVPVAVALADLVIDGIPGDAPSPPSLPAINASGQAGTRVSRVMYRGTGAYVRLVFTETGIFQGFVHATATKTVQSIYPPGSSL